MAVAKKNPLTAIVLVASGVLTVGAAMTYATTVLNNRIDERVECKTKYLVLLMQQIATPEQKKAADEEFARWNKQ
jgi:hypothetical protein